MRPGQANVDALDVARDSAYWAASSALAAWMLGLFGLVANGIGLFFIFRQLKATNDAAEAALSAATAAVMETRPWMRAWTEPYARLRDGHFSVKVTWENTGRTPAVAMQILVVRLKYTETWAEAYTRALGYRTPAGRVAFQGDKEGFVFNDPLLLPARQEERLLILACYRMSGSSKWFYTPETATFDTYNGWDYRLLAQANHQLEPT